MTRLVTEARSMPSRSLSASPVEQPLRLLHREGTDLLAHLSGRAFEAEDGHARDVLQLAFELARVVFARLVAERFGSLCVAH